MARGAGSAERTRDGANVAVNLEELRERAHGEMVRWREEWERRLEAFELGAGTSAAVEIAAAAACAAQERYERLVALEPSRRRLVVGRS